MLRHSLKLQPEITEFASPPETGDEMIQLSVVHRISDSIWMNIRAPMG